VDKDKFSNPNTKIQIDVYGTPGNDLGAFMSGPKMVIYGNAQDASGNTMNDGEIISHRTCRRLNWERNEGGKSLSKTMSVIVSAYNEQYQKKYK
jgi:glutamate synthase domain-containing protein 3